MQLAAVLSAEASWGISQLAAVGRNEMAEQNLVRHSGEIHLLLADDWKQWRGNNRDGKSAETGLLDFWPAAGPKLL